MNDRCRPTNERTIKSQIAVPAVLHVCSEVREEAKKHYSLCPKRCSTYSNVCWRLEEFVDVPYPFCGERQIYINFAVDRFLHGISWGRSGRTRCMVDHHETDPFHRSYPHGRREVGFSLYARDNGLTLLRFSFYFPAMKLSSPAEERSLVYIVCSAEIIQASLHTQIILVAPF